MSLFFGNILSSVRELNFKTDFPLSDVNSDSDRDHEF